MGHARSVAIVVASRIGSGYESAAEQGASHFVEHMLFKGTVARPSYTEIGAAIESLGGQINASTEPEMTTLWAKVGASHWRAALDVLADMAANATFRPDEIDKERRVILDELALIEDAPEEAVRRSIRGRLWPRHGVGREVAGPPENIRAVSADQLKAHARRMFVGANLVVSVAGDVDASEAQAGIAEAFGGLPEGRPAAWPPFVPNGPPRPRSSVAEREAEQAYFSVAGRTPKRADPDRFGMDVLCAALGEGMGSRLFGELRETRGIVYEVFSSLVVTRDSGAMVVEGSTDPDTLDEAMAAVLVEIGRMAVAGIGESELTRAREFIKGDIELSMEDPHTVATWYAREHLLESERLSPEEVVAKYDQVSGSDVARVARRVLSDDWAIAAAAGPLDEDHPLPVTLAGNPEA